MRKLEPLIPGTAAAVMLIIVDLAVLAACLAAAVFAVNALATGALSRG